MEEGVGTATASREMADAAALTRRAFELYRSYISAGQVIPAEELDALRGKLNQLPKREFDDARSTIGLLTLQDRIKVEGKNAGRDIMEILFGNRDAALLDSVSVLSREMGLNLNDYRVSTMANILVRFYTWLREEKPKFAPEKTKQLWSAARTLERFLLKAAGGESQEEVIVAREEIPQEKLNRELEEAFLREPSEEEIRASIRETEAELERSWQEFKVAPFEKAEELTSQILALRRAVDALKDELTKAPAGKPAKDETVDLNKPGARLRASTLQRLAKLLVDESASFTKRQAAQIEQSAKEYELEAKRLLSKKGGAQ